MDIQVHNQFLNLALCETNPENVASIAEKVYYEISASQARREDYRSYVWPLDAKGSVLRPHGVASTRFEDRPPVREVVPPKVYALAGSFDVLAMFPTPDIELSHWTHQVPLLKTGFDLNTAILPTKVRRTSFDFNDAFMEVAFSEPVPWTASKKLPPMAAAEGQDFLTLVKLKLNPLLYLTKKDFLSETLIDFSKVIKGWRKEGNGDACARQAALAVNLGWSQILVVATAQEPGATIDLALRLRQSHCGLPGRKGSSHRVATSVSALGFDASIQRAADRYMKRKLKDGTLDAEQLVKRARWHSSGEAETSSSTVWQPGFFVYPGHERVVLERLADLERVIPGPAGLGQHAELQALDAGRIDVRGPLFLQDDKEGFKPREAAMLTCLVHGWLRDSAGMKSVDPRGPLRSTFDNYTRVGLKDPAQSLATLKDHSGAVASRLENHGLKKFIDKTLLSDIKLSLRHLQVPYALAEQVVTLITSFYWLRDRDVLWDECIELIPVVLSIRGFLKAQCRELAPGLKALEHRVGEPLRNREQYDNPNSSEYVFAKAKSEEIGRLLEEQFPALLLASRTFVYNKTLSSYLTDELPDLNVRYTGSVQQLLRVANMTLDVLCEHLLGPRGCLAVLGERVSPVVRSSLGVVSVEFSGQIIRLLLHLETLAHEIGHQLANELIEKLSLDLRITPANEVEELLEARWPDWQHLKPGRRRLLSNVARTLCELDQHVLADGVRRDEPTRELVGDFSEFTCLYPADSGGFLAWTESFLFRALVSTRATEYAEAGARVGCGDYAKVDSAPIKDQRMLRTFLLRVHYAAVAHTLRTSAGPELFVDFDRGDYSDDPESLARFGQWYVREFRETALDLLTEVNKWIYERCVSFGPVGAAEGRYAAEELHIYYQRDAKDPYRDAAEKALNNYERVLPWLATPSAAARMADFVTRLHEWANPAGNKKLLRIQDAFAQYRKSFFEQDKNLVYAEVRSIFNTPEKGETSTHSRAIRHPRASQAEEYDIAVFHRGAVTPATPEQGKEWSLASSQLLLALLGELPGWLASLLDRSAEHVKKV